MTPHPHREITPADKVRQAAAKVRVAIDELPLFTGAGGELLYLCERLEKVALRIDMEADVPRTLVTSFASHSPIADDDDFGAGVLED